MLRRIFTGWASNSDVPPNRQIALLSVVKNTDCAVVYLNSRSMYDWEFPEFPFHPAFPYLNDVHKMDYLRVYTLHFYGGGYTDIKFTTKSWRPFFDLLENSSAYGLGYTEIGPHGVATVGGDLEEEMKENYTDLIGVCSLIFKRRSEFTQEWYEKTCDVLDVNLKALKDSSAQTPTDSLEDGRGYPIKWTGVGGDVFHPLIYAYKDKILHADIAPSFENYR
jgi:hypothetical protein